MDWTTNQDVINDMFMIIEDYLIEVFRNPGLKRVFDVIERITEPLSYPKQVLSLYQITAKLKDTYAVIPLDKTCSSLTSSACNKYVHALMTCPNSAVILKLKRIISKKL